MSTRIPGPIALLLLVALCAPACRNALEKDMDRLEGHWTGTAIDGRTGPCSLAVDGNDIDLRDSRDGWTFRLTFTLDVERAPRVIRGTITGSPLRRHDGKEVRAIYRFDDDRLIIAGYEPGSDRLPPDFEPRGGVRTMVFVRDLPR